MAATSGATHLASAITGLFDAIRTKASVSGSMTFAEAASVVESISTGGGGLTTVQKLIAGWAFSSVPQAEADAVTRIPVRGFYNCRALTTASFPICTTIESSAFYACKALTTINFPVCTLIGKSAFRGCTALTTVDFPVCETIVGGALTTGGVFAQCFALTTANFPVCTSIGVNTFRSCTSLVDISFPLCTSIGGSAFYNCRALTTASFPACTSIGSNAFCGCLSLASLYLMGNSVVKLVNVNAFSSTPLSAGGSGTIYVPSSLWASYQTAAKWSQLSARIVSI